MARTYLTEQLRRTRQEGDPETNKVEVFENANEQWIGKDWPHLRIVEDELWALLRPDAVERHPPVRQLSG